MTSRRCPYCLLPECPCRERDNAGVTGFAYGLASSVAIIGVGAIGSHVSEQLARAGIGRLRLIDYDRLWPVNLVRHAAPPGTPAGTPKAVSSATVPAPARQIMRSATA